MSILRQFAHLLLNPQLSAPPPESFGFVGKTPLSDFTVSNLTKVVIDKCQEKKKFLTAQEGSILALSKLKKDSRQAV